MICWFTDPKTRRRFGVYEAEVGLHTEPIDEDEAVPELRAEAFETVVPGEIRVVLKTGGALVLVRASDRKG